MSAGATYKYCWMLKSADGQHHYGPFHSLSSIVEFKRRYSRRLVGMTMVVLEAPESIEAHMITTSADVVNLTPPSRC